MYTDQMFRIPKWDCSRTTCIKRTKCFSFVIQLEQIELPPRLSLIYWSLVLEDAEEMVPNNARQLHGHFVTGQGELLGERQIPAMGVIYASP